jgi:hypothetical protein
MPVRRTPLEQAGSFPSEGVLWTSLLIAIGMETSCDSIHTPVNFVDIPRKRGIGARYVFISPSLRGMSRRGRDRGRCNNPQPCTNKIL